MDATKPNPQAGADAQADGAVTTTTDPLTSQQPPAPPPPPAPTVAKAKGKKATLVQQSVTTTTDPLTSQVVHTPSLTETEIDEVPASGKLAAPFAFYDDDGKLHSWAAGQVLTNAEEIATLIEHGAIFTAE